MARTSVPDVLAAIRGVDFPAGKDRLVAAARAASAPEEVVQALRGMTPERYADREEVAGSVRVDPDPAVDPDAARRTARAREGGRPGFSRHLREEPRTPIQEEFGR
ncbi:DUF2795 domain-containing protein [Streptomyces sp. NPDC090057]|uniref:DUF2795 domain-containing protein n=1 Tax=Streptomyces sp. NPDC090057 TaxID=3365935 RepID=UPI0037F9F09B